MVKTREAHSFRPQVRQGPTPLVGTSTPGAIDPTGPGSTAGLSSPQPAPAPACLPLLPLPQLLSRALLLLMLRAPPLWPLPRGDIIPELAPLLLLLRIPSQPEGPHRPRGLGLQAQGSHPLPDPGRHPHRLIRALPKPRTYPLHPSSGGLTSLATPSRGMLIAEGEIFMGRFTTISWYLSRTRSSETPYSSCRDTIWSRS